MNKCNLKWKPALFRILLKCGIFGIPLPVMGGTYMWMSITF